MDDRDDAAWFLLPIVLVLALLAVALYGSTRGTFPEGDRASVGSLTIALALACLVSAALLFLARERGQTGFAAGIAAGASLAFALPAGFATLWMLGWGMKGHSTSAGILGCLAFVALVLLVVASRQTRGARGSFVLGIVVGGIGFGAVATALGAQIGRRVETVQRDRDVQRGREVRARNAVFALTACAHRARAASADSTFARTLAELPGGPDCAGPPPTARALDGYTLSYTPRATSPDGRVTDFQLVAAPDRDGFESGTVVSDGRALIFVVRLHEPSDPRAVPVKHAWLDWRDRGLGRALALRYRLDEYLESRRARGVLVAPATLDEIVAEDTTSSIARIVLHARHDTSYALAYERDDAGGYTLRMTCTKYGSACLRSYLVASVTEVHATGSPRPAGRTDPLALEGESGDGAVRGVGWGGH